MEGTEGIEYWLTECYTSTMVCCTGGEGDSLTGDICAGLRRGRRPAPRAVWSAGHHSIRQAQISRPIREEVVTNASFPP